jgi:hypothetical protein
MTQIGTRVGALLSADATRVRLLGYGVYEGDLVPTEEAAAGSELLEAMQELGVHNPCIRLDGGGVVWGCQCWWGPEEKIKRDVEVFVSKGAVLETVPISEVTSPIDISKATAH